MCAAAIAHAAPAVDEATRAAAREIGYSGVDAFERGDYPTASGRLEKAYAILHAPSLGLWSARALVKLGKLVEAHERYLEVSRLPTSVGDEAVQVRARADAAAEGAALGPRLPRLIVNVSGRAAESATVTIDDVVLVPALWGESRPIDPGRHVVRASADNATAEQTVPIGEGEQKTVVLALVSPLVHDADDHPPPSATPPPALEVRPAPDTGRGESEVPRPTRLGRELGWTALGMGGAGIVLGAVAGGLALSARGDLKNNPACGDTSCTPEARDLVDSYNRRRMISSAGFIAGGSLAAIGAILILTGPASDSGDGAGTSKGLSLAVSRGAAALCGRF